MKDTGLDKFLVGLIGIPGLITCVLAWVQPMDISERILATAIGITGLVWAVIRCLSLRSKLSKEGQSQRKCSEVRLGGA